MKEECALIEAALGDHRDRDVLPIRSKLSDLNSGSNIVELLDNEICFRPPHHLRICFVIRLAHGRNRARVNSQLAHFVPSFQTFQVRRLDSCKKFYGSVSLSQIIDDLDRSHNGECPPKLEF